MLLYKSGAVALIFTMTMQSECYDEINRYLRLNDMKPTEECKFTKNAFKKHIYSVVEQPYSSQL